MLEPTGPYTPYRERTPATSHFVALRSLRYHVLTWGDRDLATPNTPPLVLLHGWMDVAASFQFMVDALPSPRWVIAPDWRGFGLTQSPGVDTYWHPDYLADLDALLDALTPDHPTVDLLGHSMGGNIAMVYAGVRPSRIRRLINLEGYGLPATQPAQAPGRLTRWLDDLKTPQRLRPYSSLAQVAQRLQHNNPRLRPEQAHWLAERWSTQGADGLRHLLSDPAHKRVNPLLYRVDETLACWAQITAPLLFAEGEQTDVGKFWGHGFPHNEIGERLARVQQVERHVLADCGHMLHHDQPQALAQLLHNFLQA